MASERQIKANRGNAVKSTGPKTPEGKKAVSLNAITHGLLDRDTIITTGGGREDGDAYTTLLTGLHESCEPVGDLEVILVEKIAVAYWKLCRAGRVEVGALRQCRDNLETQLHEDLGVELEDDLDALEQFDITPRERVSVANSVSKMMPEDMRIDIQRRIRKNPLGVRHLLRTLDVAIIQVEQNSKLDHPAKRGLRLGYFNGRRSVNLALQVFGYEESEDGLSPEDRAAVLALLREEKAELEARLVEVEHRHQEIVDIAAAQASLPSDQDIARIQRYETMHDRQFNQAINQLERVQRRRLGEAPLPVLNVEVTNEQ